MQEKCALLSDAARMGWGHIQCLQLSSHVWRPCSQCFPPRSRVHVSGIEIGGGSTIFSPREMGFNEVLNNKMGSFPRLARA